MKRNGSIVSYTAKELDEMIKNGESQTDWAKVDAMTEEDIVAAMESDPDEAGWIPYYDKAEIVPDPLAKRAISLRVHNDVLEFFRKGGRGYQTRMNAVLRAYMESQLAGK